MEDIMKVLKDLVKLADHLDRKGLHKESDLVDSLITKMAMGDPMNRDTYGGDEGDDPSEGITDSDLIEFLMNEDVDERRGEGDNSFVAELLSEKLVDMKWRDLYNILSTEKLEEMVEAALRVADQKEIQKLKDRYMGEQERWKL
jgi:hypothetical protein